MVEWIALTTALLTAAWNVYTWLRSRRTRVEVELKPILGLRSLLGTAASIAVINHSEHEVHPRRLVFELADGTERYPSLINMPRLAPVLVESIAPRDSALAILNDDDLTFLKMDRRKPVKVRLELADKQVFRSPPAVIDPRQEPDHS